MRCVVISRKQLNFPTILSHILTCRNIREKERSSIMDQMSALVRLPGDILRRDFVGAGMDSLILVQFLPLPFPIPPLLNFLYIALKFIHPAYWWLFPSTKPPNVKGQGFQRLRG